MSTTLASDFEFLRDRWTRNTDSTTTPLACWPWLMKPDGNGYGQLVYPKSKVIRAHRLSYLLHHGDIPDGLVVRHSCDNRICVNPAHLSLGTRADNLDDARSRGRWHNRKKPPRELLGGKGPIARPLGERLWAKVSIGSVGECWPFVGKTDKFGYGIILGTNRKNVVAHRAAYESKVGPIPEGLIVMHTCDNPPCCNPTHLRLGTIGDNNRDRSAKGRGRENRQNGAANPRAKLTDEQVVEIRRLYAAGELSQQKIADMFGVRQPQVSRIIRGGSW